MENYHVLTISPVSSATGDFLFTTDPFLVAPYTGKARLVVCTSKGAYDDEYSILIESSATSDGTFATVASADVDEVDGVVEYTTLVDFDIDGASNYLRITITCDEDGIMNSVLLAQPKYSSHTQPVVTGLYGGGD